jgi:DNA helicase-2/ATP-dependent DNA helicase PcrA
MLSTIQTEIVKYLSTPCVVSAGAGSGKSRVITYKFEYLVNEIKINPSEILCITFTNKAANELKSRLSNKLNLNIRDLKWVRTIHSACYKLITGNLEIYGFNNSVSIYTDSEKKKILRSLLKDTILEKINILQSFLELISKSKQIEFKDENALIELIFDPLIPEIFKKNENIVFNREIHNLVYDIFIKYIFEMKHRQCLDYDDILFYTKRLLTDDDMFKSKIKQQFKYILVDEYQDVDPLQNYIIKSIVDQNNITIVGDDAQCWHEDSLIRTIAGIKKIKDIHISELVKSIKGKNIKFTQVSNIFGPIEKQMLQITTETGKILKVSWDHKCFSTEPDFNSGFYVYIMYRSDKGFRVGVTSGGKTNKISVRTHSEKAERLWILCRHEIKKDAIFVEEAISLKYQIPKLPFYHNGHNLALNHELLDKLFNIFGNNGWKIFDDEFAVFDYPNYIAQGTTKNLQEKININLIMNHVRGGFYITYEHLGVRKNSIRMKYDDAVYYAEQLKSIYNASIIYEKYHHLNKEYLNVVPACQLTIGMKIPTIIYDLTTNSFNSILEKIIDIQQIGVGNCYHVGINETGILIANDIITHNSIYKFRGSEPKLFIDYKQTFPTAKLFKLEQNYRSSKQIVNAATNLIKHNIHQIPKTCYSIKDGILPNIKKFENYKDEAINISKACLNLHINNNVEYKDIAIIYRTRMISRYIEKCLLKMGIPYILVGDVEFFERREIKDIMSYLEFSHNKNNKSAFERSITTPKRGISINSISSLLSQSIGETIIDRLQYIIYNMNINKKQNLEISAYIYLINSINLSSPEESVRLIITNEKFKNYIKNTSNDDEDFIQRQENMDELMNMASEFSSISEFLEDVFLNYTNKKSKDISSVQLMTGHASKGLEFKVVFLVGAEENTIPHIRSLIEKNPILKKENIEEERRLFYVMMTRAEYLLNITWCEIRSCSSNLKRSRFVNEIEQYLNKL